MYIYPKPTKLVQALLTLLVAVIILALFPVAASAQCPPARATALQIPIPGLGDTCISGGKTIHYVEGLQQYISQFFNWFVGFIGLVSVVMIMIGGFMWLLAAGNSERIQAAKATIGGAISAILIVLISFTLFQTLNPDVVNLELVNVGQVSGSGGLLNAGVSGTGFGGVPGSPLARACIDAPAGSTVEHRDYYASNQTTETQVPARNDPSRSQVAKRFRCGDATAVIKNAKGEDVACVGLTCPRGWQCLDKVGGGHPEHFDCFGGYIAGNIKHDGDAYPVSEKRGFLGRKGKVSMGFNPICADGTRPFDQAQQNVERQKVKLNEHSYHFSVSSNEPIITKDCNGQVKGYYLDVLIHKGNKVNPISEADAWYAIGKPSQGTTCNTPLFNTSQNLIKEEDWAQIAASQLWQPEDFQNQTIRCDLELRRRSFPNDPIKWLPG